VRVRKFLLGGLMVVLLVSLVGCGSDSKDSNVLGSKKSADLVVNDNEPRYEPKDLEMRLNAEVSFTVYNAGKQVHNITIPGFAIDMDVEAGKTITVKLPATNAAPRDGFYTMYCKYHQSQGEATRINIAK